MNDAAFFDVELAKSKLFQRCLEEARQGSSLLFEGLFPSAKACVIANIAKAAHKPVIVLTGAGIEEFKLFSDLPFFSAYPIIELPAWETLPSENIAPSPDIVGARLRALQAIQDTQGPFLVLTSLQAALQKVPLPKTLQTSFFTITKSTTLSFQECLSQLEKMGYERRSIACDKGEFAVRGGIIDLFAVTASEPYRIEFWDNTVESIRAYDPSSQKSSKFLESVQISAAKDLPQDANAALTTLFDYLPDSLIVFDDLEALEDRYASLTSLGGSASRAFLGIEELLDLVQERQQLYFSQLPIEQLSEVAEEKKVRFYSLTAGSGQVSFEMFLRKLSAVRVVHPFQTLGGFFLQECLLEEAPQGDELLDCLSQVELSSLFFITQHESELQSLRAKLEAKQVKASLLSHFKQGYLSQGFALRDTRSLLFSNADLTGRIKIRRERQRTYYQSTAQDAFDITAGETIVHFNHGIGRFLGIEKRPNYQGIEEEYFLIEYAEHTKLYVPLTQAHLISKYVGSGEEMPKLHALGTNRWKKQREDTERSIIGYASDLLKMYAQRHMQGGFVFAQDSPETKAFEEEFPYIETDDQLAAIASIKADMCSEKAMDRLVCGDVGYGKTEVAMRAAFKAVLDGKKQVAVLVPTTVLAIQHYESFRDRMENFGVRVDLLCRFRTAKEIKKSIVDIEKGAVDVVVGTHRLLQKDIQFKDLGLIIIDEEQRFGVKAKEHLKLLKTGVDSLTLSATPIPRTLYMSLIGTRDLSVINTPPQDRLPIKTIIADPDDQLIQTAILRELNRDGQVFFIHNRIESIFETASRLQKLLPKARIAIAHGQMDPDELDSIFHAFKKGTVDILVATSIVENGIDIPNANTILVDNADHFGIADLYQLRGRVGRWNRRAFAYFLIPKRRTLSEIAKRRLDTMTLAGGYGGGMRVAMRDLEMRGAGDILGLEQSGHVSQIGFHLYCKLLKRTIESIQGKAPSWTLETKIEMPFDARLPEYYVNDVSLRMEIYQRLGDATTLEEVDSIWSEVKDRFGKPPEQARWLYHQSRVRVFAAQRGYTRIKLENASLVSERKTGNSVASNRSLLSSIKSPEEMEKKIVAILAK